MRGLRLDCALLCLESKLCVLDPTCAFAAVDSQKPYRLARLQQSRPKRSTCAFAAVVPHFHSTHSHNTIFQNTIFQNTKVHAVFSPPLQLVLLLLLLLFPLHPPTSFFDPVVLNGERCEQTERVLVQRLQRLVVERCDLLHHLPEEPCLWIDGSKSATCTRTRQGDPQPSSTGTIGDDDFRLQQMRKSRVADD